MSKRSRRNTQENRKTIKQIRAERVLDMEFKRKPHKFRVSAL